MIIESFIDTQVITKDGYWTPVWKKIIQTLLQEMQINLSDEGLGIPTQSASDIAIIESGNNRPSFLYDSTNDLGKIKIAGVFKTILTA